MQKTIKEPVVLYTLIITISLTITPVPRDKKLKLLKKYHCLFPYLCLCLSLPFAHPLRGHTLVIPVITEHTEAGITVMSSGFHEAYTMTVSTTT